jgi:hypothetical protein
VRRSDIIEHLERQSEQQVIDTPLVTVERERN